MTVSYQEHGAKVQHAQLIYTLNGEDKDEEWFRVILSKGEGSTYHGKLPKGTTHYFVNLIDEHHFLISHPSLKSYKHKKSAITEFALSPKN